MNNIKLLGRFSPFYFIISLLLLGADSLSALDISVNYSRFKADQSSYVEFNYYVLGRSTYMTTPSTVPRSVIMTMVIKSESNVIHAEKFKVNGFVEALNFSTTKRYGLEPGTYSCSLQAVDAHDPTNTFNWGEVVNISAFNEPNQLSDIQLLSSIRKSTNVTPAVKNGYVMESLPFMFSQAQMDKIYYYVESYQTAKMDKPYTLHIHVVEAYENRSERIIKTYTKTRKPKLVDVIIGGIDIGDLPSGNYKIKMFIDDIKNNDTIAETSFQHSFKQQELVEPDIVTYNPLDFTFLDELTADDLVYNLQALIPRINSVDIEAVNLAIRARNLNKIKYLLKYHWSRLGEDNYELSFKAYEQIARAVDKKFDSGYGAGFETDRGYFYLKYGRPDNIISEKNDVNAPPYEIWTYNEIPDLRQSNVKFVFYNPSLSPGNYELLHSTAKGEYNNPRWRVELTNAGSVKGDVNRLDGTNVPDNFGQNSGRYYDDN